MKRLICISLVLLSVQFGTLAQNRGTGEVAAPSALPDTTAVKPPFELDFDLIDTEDGEGVEKPVEKPSKPSKPSRNDKYEDQHWDGVYLDTVVIKKTTTINDYSMIGVQYGAGLSMVYWNPSVSQKLDFIPYNIGIMYTRYGKMFGFMPYFGIQMGLFYTKESWTYKTTDDGQYTPYMPGTQESSAKMTVLEVPVLAHMHIDFWKMKVILNIGFYGGYRLDINRSGNIVKEEYINSFTDYNNRVDWGLKGGAGIGFVFDPIEIHIQGNYKHSFSSLYKPDYNSDVYYRYAYPANIIVSVGLHVQLTKRTGKTSKDLRKEAYDKVYGTPVLDNGRKGPVNPFQR